jgi:hypothetical protein
LIPDFEFAKQEANLAAKGEGGRGTEDKDGWAEKFLEEKFHLVTGVLKS